MEPHIYHMNRFVQFFYSAMGLAFMGVGAFAIFQMGSWGLALALLPALLGIYCCRWALNSRLTLTETEISVRYAFGNVSAQLNKIESWRTESGGKSGSFWVLKFRDTSDSLRISQYFAVDDAFFGFLSKLRNLNDLEISVAP